ncbi:MAG TPA: FHA domain-containing protein, partial [Steroidobacteraceae bacterium]|nr:FHA domain-containing protein [Steroidobacteraceae bacterium]
DLEGQLEQNHRTVSQQLSELQRLRSERTELHAAAEAARSAAAAAAAQTTAHEAALAQQREHGARLDAALAAERQRAGQLEGELAAARTEMQDWGAVLRSAQQERGGHLAAIATAEARVQALEQAAAEQRQTVIMLQAENAAHGTRERELEADLRAAEDTVHRLELDVRNRSARIEQLERSTAQQRATTEGARPAGSDTAAGATPEAQRQAEEPAAVETAPDGATRLLIHRDGGREIVHVLGRKTSIGRTPDNDLQLDAKFVSRHHAVILAGPLQTIIEDLNSTNGVHVNGRRITRHTLRDGDQIAIGRAYYRFALRKGGEQR